MSASCVHCIIPTTWNIFVVIDGVQFFRSANNVILCAGSSEGILHPQYFDKVIDVTSGQSILL